MEQPNQSPETPPYDLLSKVWQGCISEFCKYLQDEIAEDSMSNAIKMHALALELLVNDFMEDGQTDHPEQIVEFVQAAIVFHWEMLADSDNKPYIFRFNEADIYDSVPDAVYSLTDKQIANGSRVQPVHIKDLIAETVVSSLNIILDNTPEESSNVLTITKNDTLKQFNSTPMNIVTYPRFDAFKPKEYIRFID